MRTKAWTIGLCLIALYAGNLMGQEDEKEELPDMCRTDTTTPAVTNSYEVFNPSIPATNSFYIRRTEIVTPYVTGKRYQLMLVPVGYESREIVPSMEALADVLMRVFRSVDVEFSYLTRSVPIGLTRINGKWLTVTERSDSGDAARLLKNVQRVFPAHQIAFIYHTDALYSGFFWRFAVISTGPSFWHKIVIHELGHQFGLDDGYQRLYNRSSLRGTELFIHTDSLTGETAEAYRLFRPETHAAGFLCDGMEVQTFIPPSQNVMSGWAYGNNELADILARGAAVFSPMQEWIMNTRIRKYLQNLESRP